MQYCTRVLCSNLITCSVEIWRFLDALLYIAGNYISTVQYTVRALFARVQLTVSSVSVKFILAHINDPILGFSCDELESTEKLRINTCEMIMELFPNEIYCTCIVKRPAMILLVQLHSPKGITIFVVTFCSRQQHCCAYAHTVLTRHYRTVHWHC